MLCWRTKLLICVLNIHVFMMSTFSSILFCAKLLNVFVYVALREEAIFLRLMRMSQTLLRKQRRPCFTNLFENMSQHARVFASYSKLIALHARTLGGNVHSCTKLFNMLNIRRRCHAWTIALKTPTHTRGELAYANSHE